MNANEIIIPCRLSYAHIWEPASVNGGDAKYSVCCIISKRDTKTLDRLNSLIEKIKNESAGKWGGRVPKKLKMPLRDGDAERDDDNYANAMFINCNSNNAPKVIDAHRNEVMDEDEVYSGCFANVKISLYAFNASGNQGIGCGLVAIQKTKDGTRLAGGSGTDGFEDIGTDGFGDSDDDEADYLG